MYPLVVELAADGIPVAVSLRAPPSWSEARGGTGLEARSPALLPLAGRPDHRQ